MHFLCIYWPICFARIKKSFIFAFVESNTIKTILNMICKNRVLFVLLFAFIIKSGKAQTELTQITQITSASDSAELVDGGLYFFSSYVVIDGKKYGYAGCNLLRSSYRPEDHIINYMGGPPYFQEASEAVPGDDLFRLYKDGTDSNGDCQYLLYDVTNGFYLFQDDLFPALYRHRSDEGEISSRHLCLKGSRKDFKMVMQKKRTLRYQNNMCYYSTPVDAYYKSKPYRFNTVQLYRIDRLDGYRNLMASGSDLQSMMGDTIITIGRKFKDYHFNTLMLPCKVGNYKEIFGLHVQAYQLATEGHAGIMFKKVDGDDLDANVPYLVYGRFAQAPYIIAQTSVDLPVGYQDERVDFNRDGTHFIGIYKDQRLEGQNAYMLSNDRLYCCRNTDCRLRAFRWYMMIEDKTECKLSVATEKGMRTISLDSTDQNQGDSIHRLRGSRIPPGKHNRRSHGFCLDRR
jgi:hypothetical protein